LIDEQSYERDIGNAELFLHGKETEVLDQLNQKMEESAASLQFEIAARFRDQIRSLQRVLTKQFVESSSERDVDVIAAQEVGGIWCVNLVMIRGGRHLGDKSLFPVNAADADLQTIIDAFVEQHYGGQTPPAHLVMDGKLDTSEWQETLSETAGRKVTIVTRPTGESKNWMAMANKNARFALEQRLSETASQEKRLQLMREALQMESLQRVECFDISHTMGEATVASCVVFDGGTMQPSQYRLFNIVGITPGDDYAAMRDVLLRRYKKIAEQPDTEIEPRLRPDLILIDGGKGQLGIAEEVMNELGLSDIQLVGVAKGEDRKPGLETLIFGNSRHELHLAKDNSGFHLIQQIRDEAHRFAITGHRAKRAKKRNTSRLEDIAGVGPKRRKALLAQFGGLQGVTAAGIDDLANVEGISREMAETIYNELRG
jgi:excinuclease ABC subunit C